MLLTRGLGETIKLDPSYYENAQANVAHGYENAADNAGGPANEAKWTRAAVDHRRSFTSLKMQAKVKDIQRLLLLNYGPQLRQAGFTCKAAARNGYEHLLYPIGTTSVLGVLFSITEIKGDEIDLDNITKVYQPDYDQRFLADFAIYMQSQRMLAKAAGVTMSTDTDIYLDLVQPTRGIQSTIANRLKTHSIRDLMGTGEWGYFDPNYGLNPIPPTQAEITQPGGLHSYYARGGYLFNLQVISGQKPAAKEFLQYTRGYALCGDFPMAILSNVAGIGFSVYLAVGSQYTIKLDLMEPGLLSKFASLNASFLRAANDFFCSGVAQLMGQEMLKDTCQDANGTSCTKGAAGCKCTKATATQTNIVGAWAAGAQMICDRNASVDAQQPDYGFVPPPPGSLGPPIILPPKVPWWIVALGGVAVGAAVFQRYPDLPGRFARK